MEKKNETTPRVVRTGAKISTKKKSKKPVSPAMRVTKKILATIGKITLTTMLVMTITGCIVGTALTIYVLQYVNSPPIIDLGNESMRLSYTTFIYGKDKDGNDVEVDTVSQKDDRIWVDLKDIPDDLVNAVIYTEDERFMEHYGIDYKRTIGAFAKMVFKPNDGASFGGSTISQQLIKNINGDISSEDRTIPVKVKEIIGSLNLENHFTKEQILENYLNYIGLGGNISGVQSAAKNYFNKDVSELTLLECTSIAVISKSPNKYNPVAGPEHNKKRRNYALKKLLEFGKITQQEYDENYDKDLVLPSDEEKEKTDVKTDAEEVIPKKEYQSYFVDSVLDTVIADLMVKYNWSKDKATEEIYTGGYRIYTTMEIEAQKIVEDFFKDPNNFKFKDKKNQLQAYMTIMNYDGDIVATVGGVGEKTGDRVLNRAMTSRRSAGSTIKPLAVYAPAFEHDIINWSTIMQDAPVQKVTDPVTGVARDWPSNYNKKYQGSISIIEALKVSKNTIPVSLVNTLTPQACFDFAHDKLHLNSLVATGANNNINPASLALGDCGVTLTELTAAYQIFGNGGYYTEPRMYSTVVDADGKTILDKSIPKQERVISPQTSYILNKGLWNVVNGGGSGADAKMSKWEVVGKTGTSNEKKDYLFMGLTPYYVAGIRYGYDDDKLTLNDNLIGVNHKKAWKAVMTKIHTGLNPAKFELDATDVIEMEYCAESGLLAQAGCPKKLIGYYKRSDMPNPCSIHGVVTTTQEVKPTP